ncbi:MAG: hypothetical protein IID44_25410 [Planctomycetes bacterium]|nr:hypothetical protein [Planctomycetota bacterium]
MIHPRARWTALCVSLLLIAWTAGQMSAGEPFSPAGWLSANVFFGSSQATCDKCGVAGCGGEQCVLVHQVKERVVGKKKVYDCKVRYEWVTIPETRYRIHNRWVTKTVPCPYCKPVCKVKDTTRVFSTEKWDKKPHCDGTLHCKTCQQKTEQAQCKYCSSKEGKTIVKVRVRECVKEPYTVYRQVRRPVCVKQPRYERTEVTITKNVCSRCGGQGCSSCK